MKLTQTPPIKFVFCSLAPIEMAFSLRMLANPSAYPTMSTWAKRKFDSLSTGLKNEILFFNDRYQWYFITDLLVDLIAEDEVCINDISILIKRLVSCDNTKFAASLLDLKTEDIDRDQFALILNGDAEMPDDITKKVTRYITKENMEYLLRNTQEMKHRLIELCKRYWAESFQKEWMKIRDYENDAIRMERIKFQHDDPIHYLMQLHPDLLIKNNTLIFNRAEDSFSISLDKLKMIVIKPSVFVEDRLNGNIVDTKATITIRLNFHTVMTASPPPIVLEMLINILNDPSRMRIVKILWNYDSTTKEIAEILGLSQTTVSLHLKQMKEGNFVTTQKVGKYVYYQLRKDRFIGIDQRLQRYLNY